MKPNLFVIGMTCALALAVPASSEILWDQSGLDPAQNGIANSISPGFGGFTIYAVGDVTVSGAGWHVESITQYYSSWNYDWLYAIAEGNLHVFPKVGPLPLEDPTLSVTVAMSASSTDPDVIEVTASNLDLDLAPGDYWIGITPNAPAGIFGANLQFVSTSFVGDPVAVYDTMFPGWGNPYGAVDGAMLIEGTRPVSVDAASWSQIKGLYR